jgi:transcriptional regulator with XRE-family HTH domain
MELTLGNQIKELRKHKNMTQEQLAEALGLTAQSVSKWETGDSHK